MRSNDRWSKPWNVELHSLVQLISITGKQDGYTRSTSIRYTFVPQPERTSTYPRYIRLLVRYFCSGTFMGYALWLVWVPEVITSGVMVQWLQLWFQWFSSMKFQKNWGSRQVEWFTALFSDVEQEWRYRRERRPRGREADGSAPPEEANIYV